MKLFKFLFLADSGRMSSKSSAVCRVRKFFKKIRCTGVQALGVLFLSGLLQLSYAGDDDKTPVSVTTAATGTAALTPATQKKPTLNKLPPVLLLKVLSYIQDPADEAALRLSYRKSKQQWPEDFKKAYAKHPWTSGPLFLEKVAQDLNALEEFAKNAPYRNLSPLLHQIERGLFVLELGLHVTLETAIEMQGSTPTEKEVIQRARRWNQIIQNKLIPAIQSRIQLSALEAARKNYFKALSHIVNLGWNWNEVLCHIFTGHESFHLFREPDQARRLIEAIVKAGANPNTKCFGTTVIHWAAEQGDLELLRLFKQRQADFNGKDWRRNTPAQKAAMAAPALSDPNYDQKKTRYMETLAFLKHHGADFNHGWSWIPYHSHTPVDLAKSPEIRDYILTLHNDGLDIRPEQF